MAEGAKRSCDFAPRRPIRPANPGGSPFPIAAPGLDGNSRYHHAVVNTLGCLN